MAFWVIFPLAALIVGSGWVMIIISAVKKLRTPANTPGEPGKRHEEDESASRSSPEDPLLQQPDWNLVDRIVSEGTNSVPLA